MMPSLSTSPPTMNAVTLRVIDEVGDLARRFGVDDAADAWPLRGAEETAAVRDNGYRISGKLRVRAEHLGCVPGLEFKVVVGIEDAFQDLSKFVGCAVIRRQNIIEAFCRLGGRIRVRLGRWFRNQAELLPDEAEAFDIVLSHVVGNAADSSVHTGAA
jgi:hypothetical protein